MKLNKELKAQLKELKRKKKLWMKYQRKMQDVLRDEGFWLNWLLEERLPFLRYHHAAYKRALRQLAKYPDSMGDTQGRIMFAEEEIEWLDMRIVNLVIGEACKEIKK